LPHVPQFEVSLASEISQPFEADVSQLPNPGRQVAIPHMPAAHAGEAFGSMQTRPQAPQFATLLRVSVSQPSLELPLQFSAPGLHDNSTHDPVEHRALALLNEHIVPQLPQFAMSALTSTSQPSPGK
jgi:hypothetical protein